METKQTKSTQELVEEFGVMLEKFGRTPMEARVFAYLLLAEPPHQSFDEIREFLNASKSAISNALKRLQEEGSVHYITFSGDRKRYFKLNLPGWQKKLSDTAKNLVSFNAMLKETLDQRKDSRYQDFNEELQNVLKFHLYFSEELDKIIDRWNNR